MDNTEELLKMSLSLAVPLRIYELQALDKKDRPAHDDPVPCIECDGEGDSHCATCGGEKFFERRCEALSSYIASHGDNILFKSKKKGLTAKAFNTLVESLALLSFAPGGVKFMNMTFAPLCQCTDFDEFGYCNTCGRYIG